VLESEAHSEDCCGHLQGAYKDMQKMA